MESPPKLTQPRRADLKRKSTEEGGDSDTREAPQSAKRPIKRSRASIGTTTIGESHAVATPQKSRRLSTSSLSNDEDNRAVSSSSSTEDDASNSSGSILATPQKSQRVSALAIASAKAIRKTIQDDEKKSKEVTKTPAAPLSRKNSQSKTQPKQQDAVVSGAATTSTTATTVLSQALGKSESDTVQRSPDVATSSIRSPIDSVDGHDSPKRTRSRLSYGGLNSQTVKTASIDMSPHAVPEIIVVPELPPCTLPAEVPIPPNLALNPLAETSATPEGGHSTTSQQRGRETVFSIMNYRLPWVSFLLLTLFIGLSLLRQFIPSNRHTNLSSSPAKYLFAPLQHLNDWKGMNIAKNPEESVENLSPEIVNRMVTKQSLSSEQHSGVNSMISNITHQDLSNLQHELSALLYKSSAFQEFVANFDVSMLSYPMEHTNLSVSDHKIQESKVTGILEVPVKLDVDWLRDYDDEMELWEKNLKEDRKLVDQGMDDEVQTIVVKTPVSIEIDERGLPDLQMLKSVDDIEAIINSVDGDADWEHMQTSINDDMVNLETKIGSLSSLPELLHQLVFNVSSLPVSLPANSDMEIVNLDSIRATKLALQEFLHIKAESSPSLPDQDSELESILHRTNESMEMPNVTNVMDDLLSVSPSGVVSELNDTQRQQQESITQNIVYSHLEENSEFIEEQIRNIHNQSPILNDDDNRDFSSMLSWGVDFAVGPRGGRVISPRRLSKVDGSTLTSPCFELHNHIHDNLDNDAVSQNFLEKLKVSTISMFKTFHSGNCEMLPNVVNSYVPIKPGRCYAMPGHMGSISLSAYAPIHLRAVAVSHYVSKAFDGQLPILHSSKSAIKDFIIVGYNIDPSKHNNALATTLGKFTFRLDLEGSSTYTQESTENGVIITQIFPIQGDIEFPIQTIRLEFISNQGERDFSCVYRLQMLGELAMI